MLTPTFPVPQIGHAHRPSDVRGGQRCHLLSNGHAPYEPLITSPSNYASMPRPEYEAKQPHQHAPTPSRNLHHRQSAQYLHTEKPSLMPAYSYYSLPTTPRLNASGHALRHQQSTKYLSGHARQHSERNIPVQPPSSIVLNQTPVYQSELRYWDDGRSLSKSMLEKPRRSIPDRKIYKQPSTPHLRPQPSACNGRRKALCIGINYTGQRDRELRGCVNDAKNIRNFLMEQGGYKSRDIVLLTDDAPRRRDLPTRDNIILYMRWLVKDAQANDSLFLHYSGHGGQQPDLDGDEIDGFDELIYPLDHEKQGIIVDDELHDIMVRPLPVGCRLTGLFDACHSGTVLDLPFIYSSNGNYKGTQTTRRALKSKRALSDVVSWSACQDSQTSVDTFHNGKPAGAMSSAFITALSRNPQQTYRELLRALKSILNPRFLQKPQLSTSHKINTDMPFIF